MKTTKTEKVDATAVLHARKSYFAKPFTCTCGRTVNRQEGERVVKIEGGYLDGELCCVNCAIEYRLDV